MKVVILGATGGSGLSLTRQALAAGHDVVTVVRSPEKLADIKDDKLQVVTGDIFSAESLQPHFENSDVVFSCLGSPSLIYSTTIYSESMKAIVTAMRGAKVSRLVVMSSWYVTVDPNDDPGWVARWVIRSVLAKPLADLVVMESYLEEECQDIDYTIVRPPQLTNDKSQGQNIKAEVDRQFTDAPKRMPREDVARFMLGIVSTEAYYRHDVAIGLE